MRRLLGLLFVVLLAVALSLAVAGYRKQFTPVAWVTLRTDHTGLQLNLGAEVELRGVQVGEVRQIASDGQGATLRLALDPATLDQIPADVTARLLPKTLFGERYVSLEAPAGSVPGRPAGPPPVPAQHLRAGAVIGQDRSSSAVELERVLDGALPLLRAIRPDKLAATLGALAEALDGRGATLGADLSTLDGYLRALNEDMPDIEHDIHALAEVASTYDGALPDLLAILRNASVTAGTIAEQRQALASFLADTTGAAQVGTDFLDRYGDRIIQLGQVTAPVLELLATYAPEYPCLLHGALAVQPQVEQAFATGRLHITLEITMNNGAYQPGRDAPAYAATDGPSCRDLPDPPVPAPEMPVADGYDHGGSRVSAKLPVGLPVALPAAPAPMGYAGTSEEQALVKPLVGAATGTDPAQVPDLADLLWGPLLRGTVVNAS